MECGMATARCSGLTFCAWGRVSVWPWRRLVGLFQTGDEFPKIPNSV